MKSSTAGFLRRGVLVRSLLPVLLAVPVLIVVLRWLDVLEGREDRAYALQYDLPGKYNYENRTYFLICVPAKVREKYVMHEDMARLRGVPAGWGVLAH